MELKLTAFSQNNSGVLSNYERNQEKMVIEKVEPRTDSNHTNNETNREYHVYTSPRKGAGILDHKTYNTRKKKDNTKKRNR